MAIQIREHNRETLENLNTLLRDNGRACVIQPSGTGATLTAMCALEHLNIKSVLFVEPRKASFERHVQSWIKEGGDPSFLRGCKSTAYQGLWSSPLVRGNPRFDAIILDEFHRLGTPAWGGWAEKLVDVNKGAYVIGLSYTSFREADRRDMASELFPGAIAGSMRLDEAWLKGALPRPIYVASLLNVPEYLASSIDARWGSFSESFKREHLTEYRDAQRLVGKVLNASGAENVLAQYLSPYPSDRVVVFCQNIEEAWRVARECPRLFRRVNTDVHVYEYHSEADELWRFECDTSGALKVLCVVDMLNTADVRLSGIRAAVMLRTTKSNDVYFRQVARVSNTEGLGDDKTTYLIDFVDNIGEMTPIAKASDRVPNVGVTGRFEMEAAVA